MDCLMAKSTRMPDGFFIEFFHDNVGYYHWRQAIKCAYCHLSIMQFTMLLLHKKQYSVGFFNNQII